MKYSDKKIKIFLQHEKKIVKAKQKSKTSNSLIFLDFGLFIKSFTNSHKKIDDFPYCSTAITTEIIEGSSKHITT